MAVSSPQTSKSDQQALQEELRKLRKGSGLSSWKLATMPAIKSIVASVTGMDEADITTLVLHDYLLGQLNDLGGSIEARATRNALCADGDGGTQRLSERRALFARQTGRHPDTIEIYENRGIDQLAQQLIRQAAGISTARTGKRPELKSGYDSARSQAASAMLSQGLSSLYGLGEKAEDLLKLLGNRAAMLNCDVELRLNQSDRGPEWFSYRIRYMFSSRHDTFRVGVTRRPHDTEILVASGLVDDIMQLNDCQDIDADARRLIADSSFAVHHNGQRSERAFRSYDDSERHRAAQAVWQLSEDAFRIYEVDLSADASSSDTRYEFSQTCDMPAKDPYAFWYAPSAMYLNSLLVDASQFQPRPDSRFIIQPFLGLIMPGVFDVSDRRLMVAAHGWIMPGNGLVILWTTPDPQAKPSK